MKMKSTVYACTVGFLLQTYRRQKVAEAIRKNELSAETRDVSLFRSAIPRLTDKQVSPAPNSSDEDAKLKKKKLQVKHLKRMRELAAVKRRVQDKVCPDWRQKAVEEGFLISGIFETIMCHNL